MILTKNVIINTRSKNKNFYKNKGYDVTENYITVKIPDLPKSSRQIVSVKCDVCGKERNLSYGTYNVNTKNEIDIYCCYKCSVIKRRKTFLKKYGVDCALKIEEFKNKSKETKIKKYDDENYTNRKLYKETLNKKYGVENISQIDEIKKKKINTTLINYGVEHPAQNKEIQKKIEKTKLEKYNDEGYHNIEKMKETNLEKYGCKNVFQNKEIKDKIKELNLEKYGVEFPQQTDIIKNKTKESKIKNGNQIPDCNLSEFKKYRYLVTNYTNKNKKELFSNWNGCDYYDSEYIKENFILNKYDALYPTIDHKISVYHGFTNNIDSKEISKLTNLCITKRIINSKKSKKCFYERKEKD